MMSISSVGAMIICCTRTCSAKAGTLSPMYWRVFSLTMDRLVSWWYSSSLYWMAFR